jgi:spore coat polysaccharide biosynthesis predicted glycosyltransferase SpsG/RimJ/RimL family protein N-acetyltransferase
VALADAWATAGGDAEVVVPDEALEAARRLAGDVSVRADGGRPLVELAAGRWVVVDGYELGDEALGGIETERIVRVDDHGHHPQPRAAVVVDPNLGATASPYLGGAGGAELLLGSRYALLRPTRVGPVEVRPVAGRLLVLLGGTPSPALVTLVNEVLGTVPEEVEVVVVGGGDLSTLGERPHVEGRGFVDDVPGLLPSFDVALAAAGTTTWELCRAGLPMVLLAAVPNQVPVVDAAVASGVALGEPEVLPPAAAVARHLALLLGDSDRRRALSSRARTVVDGRGAARVVVALRARDVALRPVTPADEDLLLEWANDPDTRAASFDTSAIERPDHHAWLQRRLADPSVAMYVGHDENGPWGQVRFEPGEPGEVELGFSVAPQRRGERLAAPLLRAGVARVLADRPDVDRVLGRVRPENHRSSRSFDAAGFEAVPDQPNAYVARRPEAPS